MTVTGVGLTHCTMHLQQVHSGLTGTVWWLRGGNPICTKPILKFKHVQISNRLHTSQRNQPEKLIFFVKHTHGAPAVPRWLAATKAAVCADGWTLPPHKGSMPPADKCNHTISKELSVNVICATKNQLQLYITPWSWHTLTLQMRFIQ